eukprot:CAMPEP_0180648356 /NCGR_PEP_ID=MMETSP1037_2-20121125/50918_1 /TAXON_ID=632150 /ORGANISM="Azadinium spinosum, Strain 3D9" /LENGTH=35 /DNA_ID= /DNA_START= /DNA_END= /DNA_ORIENTATION=
MSFHTDTASDDSVCASLPQKGVVMNAAPCCSDLVG